MSLVPLICGLIGFAVRGFGGMIVGLMVGYGLVLVLPHLIRRGADLVQAQLVESTFAAMGALCKADGQVTRNEIQVAETLFRRMGLSAAQRDAAKAAFNRGKAPDFDLDSEMVKLLRVCRGRGALLGMFLQVQLTAVAADGQVHPAEHELLVRMARLLGIPEAHLAQLEAMLRAATGVAPSASRLDDAYQALGVSPSASDGEVKRAYRRLMSQNHPDKLAGKGLPDSMREIAEERTREITAAYRLVNEARSDRS